MARDWTLFEIEDLKRLKEVEKLSNKEIASILDRTEISVIAQCRYLKISKNKYWGEQEKTSLKEFVFNTHYKINEISKKLGRTENATKERMTRIFGSTSLTKLRNKTFMNRAETKFTKNEIEFLRKFYYEKGVKKCSGILKRTSKSLKNKVCELKKQGVVFSEQVTPRFNEGAKGYVIYSNKTGKIIRRYRDLREWKKECEQTRNGG